jgi:hypothetical protein
MSLRAVIIARLSSEAPLGNDLTSHAARHQSNEVEKLMLGKQGRSQDGIFR